MRVVFFGTSAFATPSLSALHDSRHEILAVVTQPDRAAGRGMQLAASPVKKRAEALGYRTLQPEKVRRAPFPQTLSDLSPEALVVVSFGQIIPQKLLDLPRFGGINVHASLLPRWRGAAPIHQAILAGDAETGVATMQMEATLDTGPVYLVHPEPIRPDDSPASLEPRLADAGARLLIATLDGIEAGTLTPTPQGDGACYAPMFSREDGFLDPVSESAVALERRIRAFSPRPAGVLVVAGKEIKVLAARVEPATSAPPGTVCAVGRDGITIATVDGALRLTSVQPAGKPAMPAADWARGARLNVGDRATAPARSTE